MNLFKVSLALAVFHLAAVSSSIAALVIGSSDITGGEFSYSLSFGDLANATKFDADVFSQTGVSLGSDGSGTGERRYLKADAGLTNASFVYKFDFSSAGYDVTSVSFSEYLLINNSSITTNSSTTTTQWSVDGVNWTTIRTLSRTGAQTIGTSVGATNVDFAALVDSDALDALPNTVYYRVTFTSLSGSFILNSQQWGRSGPDQTNFSANFTLVSAAVPEPSTYAVLAGIAGLAFAFCRRRISEKN